MTRPLFCFCAAFALGCIASQYFLAPALWLPAAGIVLVLGALGLLLRGPMRRRVLLCALGMAFAFGWNAAYTRFIAAPNEALIGAAEDVELELCSYAVETNYGAKATVRILGRGLCGRAVYYGGFDLLALEPGEHVRDTVLFNSATDPSGDGSHIRNFTSKGVYLLLYSRGEPSYETGDAGALRYAPQRIAEKLGETIETVYGEREGGFLRALLLGDKRYLDVEDSSNLSEAGIYHITAVSGLHCMFLVELLDRLLRASHRRTRCAVTIPLLFLYAVMVGASPSILRACVMLSMTQLAPLFRREKDPPTALGLALLLILLKNPYAIASISLQLSFSAVAGLVWLTPKMTGAIHTGSRLLRFVLTSFATTLGALAFSTPLGAYYFGSFSVVSLLSNLLCLWMVSLVFGTGLLGLLLSMAAPALGAAFVPLVSLSVRYVLFVSGLLEDLPLHALYFNTALSVLWLFYVYALFAVCAIARRGRYRWWIAGALAVTMLLATARFNALQFERGSLHVTALDVGQGESVALLSRRHGVLVERGRRGRGSFAQRRYPAARRGGAHALSRRPCQRSGAAACPCRRGYTVSARHCGGGRRKVRGARALGALRRGGPLCDGGNADRRRRGVADALSAGGRGRRKRAGADDPLLGWRIRYAHHRRHGQQDRARAREQLSAAGHRGAARRTPRLALLDERGAAGCRDARGRRGERRQQQLRASDAGRAAASDGRGRDRLPDGPAGKYLYHSELRRIMAEKKTAAKGYQKFKADLAAGTLGEVYIFCGEESYLREYYLKEVQKKLVPAGFEEFNFHRVAGKGLTMEELTEMTEAMPMMAERTLIVVTDCDLYKLGEEQRTRLLALLDDFPEYCCLIFIYDLVEYKPNKTYKKLYAALSDKAQEVRFEPQDKSDLINWIARRFRATGHDIDARTAEHLMFTCGSLMTGLVPEIEKIGAYAKGRAVTVEDINAVADPVLDAVVFDMTSAVTKGDYDRASELLGQLLKKQEEPIMILGVISKELRRLYTARLALDSRKDKLWLMDLWNMRSDYPARLLLDAARKTTHEWCANSLALCQKLDRRMKSEKGIDREGELKLLLMQLAQRA